MSSDKSIIIENSEIVSPERDFCYYIKSNDDSLTTVYTAQISKSDIDNIDEAYITIFTPKMQCEAFKLYLNGHAIAVEGDIENLNSSIWARHYFYTVDSTLFSRDINEFKIVQYSRYIAGGLSIPFIIDGYSNSLYLRNYDTFSLNQAIFGTAVFMLMLLVLVISIFGKKRKMYLIMIVSLIFLMIGYIEYFPITHIGFSFLAFKKIVISSNLLAVGFGTVFFRYAFGKTKHSTLFLFCYSLIIFIPTLFSTTMPTYKTVYTILAFTVVPLIVYWAYLSIKNYRKYAHSKIMLALSSVALIYMIVFNIVETTMFAYMDSVTIVILPAFIITVLTLVIIDFHELRMTVDASNKKLTSAYKKSILDGLTQLYNAQYTKEIVKSTPPPFTFIVLDIDDFKMTNDTHGHPAGDEVLVNISREISHLLRDGDILCRYGGDEFILIIKTASKESLLCILERIRDKVEKYAFDFEGTPINVTISIGYYFVAQKEDYKSMLLKADKALYKAKKQGKNQIISYDDLPEDSCI
jgi:diguanylate cyclase (GGDEF)-like protein